MTAPAVEHAVLRAPGLRALARSMDLVARRDAVLRAGMVAGLLPMPAERQRWYVPCHTTRNDGRLAEQVAPWGHVDVRLRAQPDLGPRWPGLPACAREAVVAYGLDEDHGCWFVEVSTGAGWCRAVVW